MNSNKTLILEGPKFWVDRGAIGVQNLHCICGYKWENFALGVKNLMDVKNAKFNHIHSKYRRTWEYLHETMINEISPRSRTQPIFDLKRTNSNFWISDQKSIWSQFPILISCIFCQNSKECSTLTHAEASPGQKWTPTLAGSDIAHAGGWSLWTPFIKLTIFWPY